MSSASDAQAHATSTTDFYELLSLPPSFTSQKELDRARRRAALLYHPDKVGTGDLEAAKKFHLVSVGYEVLSDPALRATYDSARSAREQRRQRVEREDERQRAMREDLEARENAAKKRSSSQAFGDSLDPEALELRRAIAATQAYRQKLKERRAKEREMAHAAEKESQPKQNLPEPSELDRMVKVRFERVGHAETLDAPAIETLCAALGPVELAFARPDRKVRPAAEDGSKGKKIVVGCVAVLFKTLWGAFSAVENWRDVASKEIDKAATRDGEFTPWSAVHELQWAQGEEPAVVKVWAESGRSAAVREDGPADALSEQSGYRPSREELVFLKGMYADKRKREAPEPGAVPRFTSFKPAADADTQTGAVPKFSFKPKADADSEISPR